MFSIPQWAELNQADRVTAMFELEPALKHHIKQSFFIAQGTPLELAKNQSIDPYWCSTCGPGECGDCDVCEAMTDHDRLQREAQFKDLVLRLVSDECLTNCSWYLRLSGADEGYDSYTRWSGCMKLVFPLERQTLATFLGSHYQFDGTAEPLQIELEQGEEALVEYKVTDNPPRVLTEREHQFLEQQAREQRAKQMAILERQRDEARVWAQEVLTVHREILKREAYRFV